MGFLQILKIISYASSALPLVEKAWQYFVSKSAQKQVAQNAPVTPVAPAAELKKAS